MTPNATVIGGGISGVACANALSEAGVRVQLRERSQRLAGRMASRTMRDTGTPFDGRLVDIGASYFTVSDPRFAAVVEALVESGVARAWTDAFHVADSTGVIGVSTGPTRYAAPAGLRSIVESLIAADADVQRGVAVTEVVTADRPLVDGDTADAAALCMPLPQAARIWADAPTSPITWEPVIAVTCVFEERRWIELDGVFVNDDPVLTWIADDGSRRGDGAPVLVAHVNPVLAALHLDEPAAVAPLAIATLRRVLGIDVHPDWVDVHRWTYAKPLAADEDACWVHEGAPIGLAGDAWAGGPRVEAAWLSGHALGTALGERLG